MKDLNWHVARGPRLSDLSHLVQCEETPEEKTPKKKRATKPKKINTGLAPYMRKSFKGKKEILEKGEALGILKRAFTETFPDLAEFATMTLSKPGTTGKGEQTLTLKIKERITKADVL